jgi:hypothetical protein
MQKTLIIIFLLFNAITNSCSQINNYEAALENTLNTALTDINLTINELPIFSSEMLNKKISFVELVDSINNEKYFAKIKSNEDICNINIHITGTPSNTFISVKGNSISYSDTTVLLKNFNYRIKNKYLTILSLIEDSENINKRLSLKFEVREGLNNPILKGSIVLPVFYDAREIDIQKNYIVSYLTDYFDNLK